MRGRRAPLPVGAGRCGQKVRTAARANRWPRGALASRQCVLRHSARVPTWGSSPAAPSPPTAPRPKGLPAFCRSADLE
eukprot:scaffold6614_cov151-Isochrysis_galbana.AAC.1